MNHYICSIRVFAVHPSCQADEIARQLEWEPSTAWSVGDERRTPDGKRLPGFHPYTRCSFYRRYKEKDLYRDRNLSAFVFATVEHLVLHKDFVRSHLDSGGTLSLMTGVDGEFNTVVVFPPQLLKTIGELGIELSVECFPDGLGR